jgi:hypothetical protein
MGLIGILLQKKYQIILNSYGTILGFYAEEAGVQYSGN